MPSVEQGVPIQTDTLTQAGPPVRTLAVTAVSATGVTTTTQMQVVTIADANGNIFERQEVSTIAVDTLNVLRDIRAMLSKLSDMPFVDNQSASAQPGA